MSTATFKGVVAFLSLALAGCGGGFGFGSSNVPDRIALSDGTQVVGPPGWCVDTGLTQQGAANAVVILGHCMAMRGRETQMPDVLGVLAVAVEMQLASAPTAADLETLFAGEEGLALLAGDSDVESILASDVERVGETVFIRTEQNAGLGGTEPETWRAIFSHHGRLFSISLRAVEGEVISPEAARRTLSSQANQIRTANQVVLAAE